MNNKQSLLEDLHWRGLVSQCTHEDILTEKLNSEAVTLYAGFDPTAQSLHVGNLIPLLTLARFQRAGHKVLALVGGSTGQIGDPSGKSAERDFQDTEIIATRTALISKQLSHFLELDDPSKGKCVNNLDWTQGVGVLEFLREIGKHFSVNAMMHRDSVKSRLEREDTGISFTEFSYMLLQAFDFLHLARAEGCTLQIGGSDQWGNMCSGVDLIHRKLGKDSFALTLPLLTTHDGKKFGKSEKGAIWLDPTLTSPWDFMQFWKNTDDKDVVRFLKLFTFLSKDEIDALEEATVSEPHLRTAQIRLAQEMTDLVHGRAVRDELEVAANVLFGKGEVATLSPALLETLVQSVNSAEWTAGDGEATVAKLLVLTGLETSMTRAAKVVQQGGVSLNQVKVTDAQQVVSKAELLHGRFVLLKKGKRDMAFVTFPEH